METKYGEIIIGYDERTGLPERFQWQGGRVAQVQIRTLLVLGVNIQKKYFRIGPFWVRNLGYGERGQYSLLIMRSGGWAVDQLAAWAFDLCKWLKLMNERVLWTLDIWNLLEREPNNYPGWEDMKIWRRIYRGVSRWLTARYVSSSRTNDGLSAVVKVKPYDPLFWLWLYLHHP